MNEADDRALRPVETEIDENGVDLAGGERLPQLPTTSLGDLDCLGAGRPKDLAMLPVLRATLKETLRRS